MCYAQKESKFDTMKMLNKRSHGPKTRILSNHIRFAGYNFRIEKRIYSLSTCENTTFRCDFDTASNREREIHLESSRCHDYKTQWYFPSTFVQLHITFGVIFFFLENVQRCRVDETQAELIMKSHCSWWWSGSNRFRRWDHFQTEYSWSHT